jgi:thiol-disulfide isomerase/thioredoxin
MGMSPRLLVPVFLAAALPAAALAEPAQPPASTVAPSPTVAGAAAPAGPIVGAPAPAFSVKALDGKTLTLESFRGKTLVINVWATWCPPCREEMPDLMSAAPKYAKDGSVAFLGVDTTEEAPIVRAYAAAKGVPYTLAVGTQDTFGAAYDIQAFPTTFVIDPSGVLRARYVDTLAPRQLAELVSAGKAGRNAVIVSPLQAKIDASLASPALAFTSNDPTKIEATAKAADAAIDHAEAMLDESDASTGNSTDFFRTHAEEEALREKAIAALLSSGTSVTDKTLLPRMSGDAAIETERWKDALDAYHAVLTIDPKNTDALGGIAAAESNLHDYDAAVAADERLAVLAPDDAGGLVDLALEQAKAGHASDSYATFARAVDVAKRHVEATHGKASAVRRLAWVHLYFGRTYAKNGDAPNARAQFDEMLAWTQKLPQKDERHDMYLEEGQEAIAALELATPHGISVSLAPWVGAELPGSVPNTIKYRLVLAGTAGRNVTLDASGLPKAWVASFCSDKVCAPMHVAVVIPPSGVKIVEFQLIPPSGKSAAPKVRVTGRDGAAEATATT